ncbi:hypothetical protein CDAR_371071 [Caerostris darwini]|uniref:Uncharacterized protein n=1 Tax=Caerostris darwini TaxID=1538125 RepID=A0AAV4QAL2_9ARAC|nr:hypothetical protein CDAR_371071 [Caerostris darwini]
MDGPKVTSRNALPFLLGEMFRCSSIDGQLSISGNTACQKLRLRWTRYSKRNSGTTARGAQSFHSSVLAGAHKTTPEVKRRVQSNCSSFPLTRRQLGFWWSAQFFILF